MNALTKKILIWLLIAAITYMHYAVEAHNLVLHVIHRELYFIPILLASYWFGKKFGLVVSIASSFLFLPQIFINDNMSISYTLSSCFEVLMFNGAAYFLGSYQDIKRSRFVPSVNPAYGNTSIPGKRTILVCIDNSENAHKIAPYIADHFTRQENLSITVMGFVREPSKNLFPNEDEYHKAMEDSHKIIADLVEDARKKLTTVGFSAESITSKIESLNGESIAAKILEEQDNIRIDTVILGGTKMTKAEEFILGNIPVKLVRASNCPVVTVF